MSLSIAKVKAAKALSVVTILSTVLSGSGFALAVMPSDYGLKEGDTISATGSDDPDVYIVNELGYKRLFLNPVIFGFYGHLGGFANVKSVSAATRDAFPTSGLFRNCETNDEKVYGVETTGEDTGMLHWVNTSGAQAVADDPNFFKKVFCINNNEFNWYAKGSAYTSVSQVPNYSRTPGATGTPVPTGPLSVSLAPGNPSAQTITTKAQGLEMLRVRMSGSGTISTMTFKRGGAGATGDFANAYIYDGARRLTSGKSFSSATGEVTFVGLSISVSGTKDISFVVDMNTSGATTGDVNNVSLTAVTASGTVSGIPLLGNNFQVGGAAGGTITLAKVGSLANPNVGASQAQISEFKLTANTEAASVKRIQMLQGGTVKPADIQNATLKSNDGKEWSGTMASDGFLVFDMGSGHTITKGGSATYKVYADLTGKKDETIQLYFEVPADIQATGDQFGFGMAATITAIDTAGEAHSITLQGGALTIVQAGPTAKNIPTTVTDVTLLNFNMTAAANMEVRKTEFTLCHDSGGEGTYDAGNNANGWTDITDFKVTDIDTGVVVIGPQDGSTFTTSDTSTCPNGVTGAQKSFTDTLDLTAGKTYKYRVTADLDTGLDGAGLEIAANDRIKAVLDDYTDDTPDVTVMKYAGTNTAVADADIVPGSDISGPDLTVSAASLTLGLSGSPGSQVFVRGEGQSTAISAVGFTFTTSLASAVKVTDITLTGYVDDDGNNPFAKIGSGSDANLKVGNLVSEVQLVEAESNTVLASAISANGNNLSTSTGTAKFNGLTWNIPAGTTRTLLVKTKLSTNATSGSADYFSFDIDATTDVTGQDDSAATVNPSNSDPNGSTTPTVTVTVIASGSLTIARAPDNPGSSSMYWGEVGHTMAKFRFTSNKTTTPVGNEGFFIETIKFQQGDGFTAADFKNNINRVYMTYKDKAGNTLTAGTNPDSNTSASFGFSSGCLSGPSTDCRPYVPKGSSMDVTVTVDLKDNEQSTSNKSFSVMLNGGDASTFRAVGESSGQVKDGATGGINDVSGQNSHFVYRVFPRFEKLDVASPYTFIGTPTVFKFRVTAMGLSTSRLLFDNQATGSGSIKFEVVSSGQWVQANASTAFSVYEITNGMNDLLDNNTLTQDARSSTDASMTVDFSTKDIEISGGQSKDFRIQIDNPNANYAKTTDTGRAADYFQVILRDNEASLINWVDNSAFGQAAANQTDTASTRTTGLLKSGEIVGPTFTR